MAKADLKSSGVLVSVFIGKAMAPVNTNASKGRDSRKLLVTADIVTAD